MEEVPFSTLLALQPVTRPEPHTNSSSSSHTFTYDPISKTQPAWAAADISPLLPASLSLHYTFS